MSQSDRPGASSYLSLAAIPRPPFWGGLDSKSCQGESQRDVDSETSRCRDEDSLTRSYGWVEPEQRGRRARRPQRRSQISASWQARIRVADLWAWPDVLAQIR